MIGIGAVGAALLKQPVDGVFFTGSVATGKAIAKAVAGRMVKLQLEPKAPLIECRLVDYSAGGACLEFAKPIQLPERFEMFHGNTRKRVRRVWSRGVRVGVSF